MGQSKSQKKKILFNIKLSAKRMGDRFVLLTALKRKTEARVPFHRDFAGLVYCFNSHLLMISGFC